MPTRRQAPSTRRSIRRSVCSTALDAHHAITVRVPYTLPPAWKRFAVIRTFATWTSGTPGQPAIGTNVRSIASSSRRLVNLPSTV